MNKQKAMIAALGAISVFSVSGLSQAAISSIANDAVVMQREAGEGPRGGDNERAGDRQRRGGGDSGRRLMEDGKFELARASSNSHAY